MGAGKKSAPYDPGIRQTPAGTRLYPYWKKVRTLNHDEQFENYADFYGWAINNGYTIGSKLCRIDDTKPYGPDNCMWKTKEVRREESEAERKKRTGDNARIRAWNKTVNKLRVACGKPPFPVDEDLEDE